MKIILTKAAFRLAVIATVAVPADISLAEPKQDPYNPRSYLQEEMREPPQKPHLTSKFEFIHGVRYLRVETVSGVLLIPYASKLDIETIKQDSVCGTQVPEGTVAEVQKEVSNQVKIFASLIAQRIDLHCDQEKSRGKPATNLNLDLGVRMPNKEKDGGETRIFNRNLGPNLFFQKDF